MLLHVSDTGIQLNEAVGIKPSSTFSNFGYTFIGWAKLHKEGSGMADHKGNAVAAPTDGSVMDYALTEDNLYLKFEDGKFLVENGTTWTETTYVAADEKLPYDDMYAVWVQQYFYVYHSGVNGGNLETIPLKKAEGILDENGKFNLAARTTDGTLYGGYYLEDGFTAPAAVEEKIPAYDGDNWTWTTAQTESGLAMTPAAEVTYYIKEVPASRFLQPYTHYSYYKANNRISNLWMISDIDDLNYQQTGFVVVSNNAAKVCKSLTVKSQVGGASVKLMPTNVFRAQGATANDYLTYLDLTGKVEGASILQYWITPDGLVVTGIVQRTLTNTTDRTKIVKADETVPSTITAITAP